VSRSEAEELHARIGAALPALEAQAAKSEELRRPSDEAIRILEETGVFRSLIPRVYDGLELDLDDFARIGLRLGEADISLAWVANFYIEHNWLFCQFPEAFQRKLFSEQPYVLSPAALAGDASVEACEGGYRVTGRWRWGSGSAHGNWAMVGGAIEGLPHFLALPRSDVEVDDNWDTSGMRGTGSNDIVVDNQFVPEERTASLLSLRMGCGIGAELHTAPIYRTPMVVVLMMAAATPSLGQARARLRAFEEKTVDRERMNMGRAERSKASVHMRLADAQQTLREAELVIEDVVAQAMEKRNQATLQDRAGWALGLTRAVHKARQVIQSVADASGGSAHFSHDPSQRALRDVNVVATHVAFDWDGRHQLYGATRLGIEPESALV